MRAAEHDAKNPAAARTGCFATLVKPFRRPGIGAPALGRNGRRLLLLATVPLVTAAALALPAVPASAACAPPTIEHAEASPVYATRAELRAGGTALFSAGRVHISFEYATSAQGPWTLAGSAIATVGNVENDVGQFGQSIVVHHLTAATPYFARVSAEDECGLAFRSFQFTTAAVAAPEITNSHGARLGEGGLTTTSTVWHAQIETNGAPTEYHFEYATSEAGPWSPFSPGAEGTITVAEDSADPEAQLTGLSPETTYYVRVKAANGHEPAASSVESFQTRPTHPEASGRISDVTANSAALHGSIVPDDSETHWRFEYATSETGPWSPGPEGAISAGEADSNFHQVEAQLTGLSPETTYYVRLFAENGHEPAATSRPGSFATAGKPVAITLATHALRGEAIRVLGSVDPHNVPPSAEQAVNIEGSPTNGTFTLTFAGQTTAPIELESSTLSPSSAVTSALEALSTVGNGNVEVRPAGNFLVVFVEALSGVDQPQLTCDPAGLIPSGTTCTVATVQQGSGAYDTHYRFQYVTKAHFEAEGFANAASTPEVDIGAGRTRIVGADLAGLQPGQAYEYRILATSPLGEGQGLPQALTVPVPAPVEPSAACPNQALRTGPSAHLPDCRAYEQLTPVEKEGSMDNWGYSGNLSTPVLLGEDGDHLMVKAQFSKWGPNADATNSSYFFSRQAGSGWQMTSLTPQPTAGADSYRPSLFSPDLTQIGLNVGWSTGTVNASPELEFKAGPPGGPYVTVATVPRKYRPEWAAASAAFGTAVLRTEDRTLVPGHPTGTKQGDDLYEYSEGALHQLNVSSAGTKLGTCGATIAQASVGGAPGAAVSADGRRVFFEAIPGSDCSQPSHLYMRTGGAETLDFGPYRFLAADPAGAELILEKRSGEAHELFLYETESATAKPLFAIPGQLDDLQVSQDLSAIYFTSPERLTPEAPPPSYASEDAGSLPVNLYRYDLSAAGLRFVLQAPVGSPSVSPDGRYLYFSSDGVAGVFRNRDSAGIQVRQAYRYDSAEGLLQCVSCASPFAPQPQQASVFQGEIESTPDFAPTATVASANGDYVFFDTAAALLPQDADGEFAPGTNNYFANGGNADFTYSVSSDVYEWRKNGIDGCTHVQGCLALISSGTGGLKNILLGTDSSGRDVFFATHSQLAPSDADAQGDVYDARIGGGFPPRTAPPVECEGDACSHPVPAPNDPTPASETFHGAGNEHPKAAGKHKRHKKHPKHHGKKHKKSVKAHTRHANTNRRAGR